MSAGLYAVRQNAGHIGMFIELLSGCYHRRCWDTLCHASRAPTWSSDGSTADVDDRKMSINALISSCRVRKASPQSVSSLILSFYSDPCQGREADNQRRLLDFLKKLANKQTEGYRTKPATVG